jgi:trigger factor
MWASLMTAALAVSRPAVLLRPMVCAGPVRASGVCMLENIKVDVRKQPKSSVALDISIPGDVTKSVHEQVLSKLGSQYEVDGYRKGKVPRDALMAKIGSERLKLAVVEELIDVGMSKSGSQMRLQTIGEARLQGELQDLAKVYEPGKAMTFTIAVDVYPEVPISADLYTGLKVEVEAVPFNQDAYDAAILKLRDQHADLQEAEEGAAAKPGNQLLVDMVGYAAKGDGSKGERLPAVAGGDNVQLPLKPGKFMPGLVEGLVGVKKGETRDIRVTFPARTSVPELAGKEAIFEVTCQKVQRRIFPELTDGFANKVKTGMTFKELDEKLREGVQQEVDAAFRKNAHRAIEKALLKALPAEFEVPQTLLEQVSKERFAAMLSDMRERGTPDEKLKELITKENYERYLKIAAPMSAMQVKVDFSLKTVGQQQGLTVSRDDVDDEVRRMHQNKICVCPSASAPLQEVRMFSEDG